MQRLLDPVGTGTAGRLSGTQRLDPQFKLKFVLDALGMAARPKRAAASAAVSSPSSAEALSRLPPVAGCACAASCAP